MTASVSGDESLLQAQLAREGWSVQRWSNGPHAVYGLHQHPYEKLLVVIEGTIAFSIGDRRRVLQAGGRLKLPAGTPHRACVGATGVVCLEAHR